MPASSLQILHNACANNVIIPCSPSTKDVLLSLKFYNYQLSGIVTMPDAQQFAPLFAVCVKLNEVNALNM